MRTALVLGGGGITGIAWEIGVLKGLKDLGIDLTAADIVIGTSAGSVVGTLITSLDLDWIYQEQLQPADKDLGSEFGRTIKIKLAPFVLAPGSNQSKRRRIGAVALRAHPPGGHERIQIIADRIEVTQWPADRDLRITAVNADTGAFKVFDKDSGVDIIHAVAASCAVPLIWPAVHIDDVPYIDGGMRSATNADVAGGADVVVVLAPMPTAYSRSTTISAQLNRTGAQRTAVVVPSRDATRAIGKNMLDPSRREVSANAGRRQALEIFEQVQAAWPADDDEVARSA